jgi:tRNA A37 methylthiotransferase MiaB
VHPETITERSAVLRALAERKQREFQARLVGERREAVLEDGSEIDGRRQATTDNYVTVHVPDTGLAAGTLVDVDVTGSAGGLLLADIAGTTARAAGGS